MQVVPLRAVHLAAIRPQHMQSLPPEHMHDAMIAPTGLAWAGLVNGHPIVCAGVVELWPGRGQAWALLDKDAGPHLLAVTRAIRSRLDGLPFRRVEMAVDAGFPQAIRWAYMLGFALETPEPMRGYTPTGRACYQFARVR